MMTLLEKKEVDRLYSQRPEVKESRRLWLKNNPDKFKKTQQKYLTSDKGKESRRMYSKTPEGKKTIKSWQQSNPDKLHQYGRNQLQKYGSLLHMTPNQFRQALFVWSNLIKCRDGACIDCGGIENLEAHHILSKKDYSDLILVENNGVTLCVACHKNYTYWDKIMSNQDTFSHKRMTCDE